MRHEQLQLNEIPDEREKGKIRRFFGRIALSGGKNFIKGMIMITPPLMVTGLVVEARLSEHNHEIVEEQRKNLTRDFFEHFDNKAKPLEGSAAKVNIATEDIAKYKEYLKQHGIDLDNFDPNHPAPEKPTTDQAQVAAGPTTLPVEASTSTTSTTVVERP